MMMQAHSNGWMNIMAVTQELLDMTVLEEFRETAGDAVFLEIGETFVEQIALIISRIEESSCLDDLDCLERNAHELAGAAGAFGGKALAAAAREVMAVGRTGDVEKTRTLIPSLANTGRETLEAFRRYCASLS